MHYLKLALHTEGPSDFPFLSPVLRRLAVDVCSAAERLIEIDDEVLNLNEIPTGVNLSWTERLKGRIEAGVSAFNVLFLHADGAGDPLAARTNRFQPFAEWMLAESTFDQSRPVAVIPVREMEAWALADGNALRGAFGTILGDRDLGLPGRPREVEKVPDPKSRLEQALLRVVGQHRRKQRSVNFLSVIGERVRLDRLRQVPAFRTVEEELVKALQALGYFR